MNEKFWLRNNAFFLLYDYMMMVMDKNKDRNLGIPPLEFLFLS